MFLTQTFMHNAKSSRIIHFQTSLTTPKHQTPKLLEPKFHLVYYRFLIGVDHVQVGVVVFSDRAAIAIPLDNNFNKDELLISLDGLDRAFLGGGNNLAEGFRLINTAVNWNKCVIWLDLSYSFLVPFFKLEINVCASFDFWSVLGFDWG